MKYVLGLVLVAASFLFSFAPNCGLIYDGGMYASLAYSLYKNQEYVCNGATGDLPPVFPLLLAFSLFFGERGVNYVTPIFTMLLVTAALLFLRNENRAIYAFLGSLILLFHPSIFEYSITIARDVPVLFFTLTCYLIYENNKKEVSPISSALLGVFMALAFLSTYSALIYLLPIFIHAALNRKKSILQAIAVAVILIFPWAA
ncbi:MAG: glycosyltransferase family 39 protein, partial [Candidatus Hydrothermarchaeota archaeon]|nr:glycosyltransferase family 39 protein [Candidatus Hydrothermarchaeota archaeon]